MAKMIAKTLHVTRVSFKTVVVEDGVPHFEAHPDAVFSGKISEARAKRMLQGRYGKDSMLVITNVDAGQHRFEMPLEFFVQNATISDSGNGDGEADDEGTGPDANDNGGASMIREEAAEPADILPDDSTGQAW